MRFEEFHLEVHSVEVRQVPIRPEVAVQASLGNFTTEKSARDSLAAMELFAGTAAADAAKPKSTFVMQSMLVIFKTLPSKIQRRVILICRGGETTTAARSLAAI